MLLLSQMSGHKFISSTLRQRALKGEESENDWMLRVMGWEPQRVLELAYITELDEALHHATVCAWAPVCVLSLQWDSVKLLLAEEGLLGVQGTYTACTLEWT